MAKSYFTTGGAAGPVSNTSGQGAGSVIPSELRGRWNWGGFLLTPFWGIGNRVWIALLAFAGFIPVVGGIIGLGMGIYMGVKGTELAWQNKTWNSVEHFEAVQRKWTIAGVVVMVLCFVMVFTSAMTDPGLVS